MQRLVLLSLVAEQASVKVGIFEGRDPTAVAATGVDNTFSTTVASVEGIDHLRRAGMGNHGVAVAVVRTNSSIFGSADGAWRTRSTLMLLISKQV